MRTKTPKQIHEQWRRLTRYATNRNNIERVKRAAFISRRYCDNIFAANGINIDKYTDTAKINEIWETASTPASIYAKSNNQNKTNESKQRKTN